MLHACLFLCSFHSRDTQISSSNTVLYQSTDQSLRMTHYTTGDSVARCFFYALHQLCQQEKAQRKGYHLIGNYRVCRL